MIDLFQVTRMVAFALVNIVISLPVVGLMFCVQSFFGWYVEYVSQENGILASILLFLGYLANSLFLFLFYYVLVANILKRVSQVKKLEGKEKESSWQVLVCYFTTLVTSSILLYYMWFVR